ncbi:uncharacterized protein LACBIDRAFT_298896 [Laccaria bicolor S238N-H82]|uniref:Uncharacterized protein n=1 Tax=Laccaria bicolor (strain S238N-H82 / ATCC MYA-4686) TaxID=486041 RepID=B0DE90_LACBS|nr:uncharacterized protein LACBIDRAFT_298896 [Laccaria bicolor S238N-H82]EDR07225.1 hypothetical protein LACBIDRAFT_298896 [Laccaria bicolor S238N-H82]|eukprot:XP_001882156.1 hypothetical protein LACBIDRAFT_298896 [Laccaria bicolor S238N-H82]
MTPWRSLLLLKSPLVSHFSTSSFYIYPRPLHCRLAPHGFLSIKATIKISSTKTGVIFGSILWEGQNMAEACVILNDIHINIMDYIKPAYRTEHQFRSMWAEFEWEIRVHVNYPLSCVPPSL